MKNITFLPFLAMLAFTLSGCGVPDVKNYFLKEGSELKNGGGNSGTQVQPENINPIYFGSGGIEASDPTAAEIDRLIKKALSRVFTEGKLLNGGDTASTPFIFEYLPRKLIDIEDGEALHKAFLDLESRPKGDAPVATFPDRKTVEFSVFHDFGGRTYILAVVLDLGGQKVWVSVY
ncbi:MAG: hypothetical protein FJZ04_03410 [Candidatus Moranbacteria bacterium]|nr:hypothetical protein [Candidatus Moranbacteria bacterium]